jgi:hypothetical protein
MNSVFCADGLVLSPALAAYLSAAPTVAQIPEAWRRCARQDGATIIQQIDGCAAMIQSGAVGFDVVNCFLVQKQKQGQPPTRPALCVGSRAAHEIAFADNSNDLAIGFQDPYSADSVLNEPFCGLCDVAIRLDSDDMRRHDISRLHRCGLRWMCSLLRIPSLGL